MTISEHGDDASNLLVLANQAHVECEALRKKSLLLAMQCGDLLIRAKRATKHGRWKPEVESRFSGGLRNAQVYMALARNRSLLENRLGDLNYASLTAARRVLAPRKSARSAHLGSGRFTYNFDLKLAALAKKRRPAGGEKTIDGYDRNKAGDLVVELENLLAGCGVYDEEARSVMRSLKRLITAKFFSKTHANGNGKN